MFNTFIKRFRKVTQFLYVTAILSISGVFSVSVFAASPGAGGG